MIGIAADEPRINDRIRAREVRLVGADGEQIGIKPLPEALAIARQLDLDLVEVAGKANPPVCRIMDYGKFKYETAQRAKESRRKSIATSIKEMKYRPKIGPGDFDTKTKKVIHFLEEGHKVKVTLMFRGREQTHPELGRKILDRVVEATAHVGRVETAARTEGRQMTMVLGPDKKAQAAAAKAAAQPAEDGVSEDGLAPLDDSAAPTEELAAPAATVDEAPAESVDVDVDETSTTTTD